MALHEPLAEVPDDFARGELPPLVDREGRVYTYLRLSITDRCDLACIYCMPPGGEEEHALRSDLLTFEEIATIVRLAARMGVRRVRLSGGEPLVRRGVVELVRELRASTPIEKLAMTTNATRLAELGRPLRDAGLGAVNVSIDSLDPATFARLTRGGDLGKVLAGIDEALALGLETKLNAVLVRGENDHEIEALVDFAWARGISLRFIELMPLGEGAKLGADRRVPAAEVVARLGERLAPDLVSGARDHGPARYRLAADGSGRRVGFITPISDEFCASCNRVRLTAQGDLRACLASRKALSLRDLLRDGADERTLAWALHASLGTKAAGHFFLDGSVVEHEHVGMSLIGG